MDERDETLMSQYGITVETRFIFHFDGRRYDRLADAVSYAKIQHELYGDDAESQEPGSKVD